MKGDSALKNSGLAFVDLITLFVITIIPIIINIFIYWNTHEDPSWSAFIAKGDLYLISITFLLSAQLTYDYHNKNVGLIYPWSLILAIIYAIIILTPYLSFENKLIDLFVMISVVGFVVSAVFCLHSYYLQNSNKPNKADTVKEHQDDQECLSKKLR